MRHPPSSRGVPKRRRRKSRRGRDMPSTRRQSPPGGYPKVRQLLPQPRTPITRSTSNGCSPLPKPATGMGCATTRSKAATAIQKWSRATAGICLPCTPPRRSPDERARSTVALPRLVRRVARQSSDTSALALPLRNAPTTFTSESPATTRTKPIRLHQVWQPASVQKASPTSQRRRLKSYQSRDNFRLSLGQKDLAAPQGLRQG